MRGRPRVLVRLAPAARCERGREALVIRLDRDAHGTAKRLDELLRLVRLAKFAGEIDMSVESLQLTPPSAASLIRRIL